MSPKHMRKELMKRLKEDLVVIQQEEVKTPMSSHAHFMCIYMDTAILIQTSQNMLLIPAGF